MQGRAYAARSSVDIDIGLEPQCDISSLPAAAGKATSKIEAALEIHSALSTLISALAGTTQCDHTESAWLGMKAKSKRRVNSIKTTDYRQQLRSSKPPAEDAVAMDGGPTLYPTAMDWQLPL